MRGALTTSLRLVAAGHDDGPPAAFHAGARRARGLTERGAVFRRGRGGESQDPGFELERELYDVAAAPDAAGLSAGTDS
jgi:hypothetical protein